MTIGVFERHAFLIKKIERLGRNYICEHCPYRFTQACHLQRHALTCSRGDAIVKCPNEKLQKPQTKFEKAFFPEAKASAESIRWLEREAKRRKIHIRHARCGDGGEVWLLGRPVEGFHLQTKSVFQYHGCWWHGCPNCYPYRNTKIAHDGTTRETLFQKTGARTNDLRAAVTVTEMWTCQTYQTQERIPPKFTKTYSHAILFDFEAYGDKTKRSDPTSTLRIENVHKPICFSIGDTLNREPSHITDKNPKVLIKKFVEEIEKRGERIGAEVRKTFLPDTFHLLTKSQRMAIQEWCDEVPVLGFNSGRYDLNLVKEYLYETFADSTKKSKVAKNANKIMYLITSKFRFLDIINYLGPGTSYDKWVKPYGCELTKPWFPYEWFDSPDKLDFLGLPNYPEWYSSLKGGWILSFDEWKSCVRTFKEKGMKTSVCGLIALLQQSGRGAGARSAGQNARFLHRKGD